MSEGVKYQNYNSCPNDCEWDMTSLGAWWSSTMKISLYFTQYISQNQYISKNTLYECKNLRENSLPHAFRSVNHESFSMSCQSFVFTSAPAKCVHDCWSEKPTLCNPFFFKHQFFFQQNPFWFCSQKIHRGVSRALHYWEVTPDVKYPKA